MKIKSYKEAELIKAALTKFHLNKIQKAVNKFGYAGLSRKLSEAGFEKCSDTRILSVLSRESLTGAEKLSLEIKSTLYPDLE
ncbi:MULTISPECIES: hypothetical protein [Leptospira]|uniref:Uncharacterized protein n=1 Tax=Leptospira interrogans str. UI 12758 TaxID=1049938 RepID=A0A0E2CZS2_LEPIR|nr:MULTISPECIES: hypothetical protein [Leptospira]EKR52832.1 hypothetical protein LEP1GSC105_0029 [Leptospira interrogans str. UI 12758]KGE27693.1 hypothetical protein IQ65_05145 [Leptospira interrogans serovar Lai]QCO35773.1 hypothetical protein E4414_22555 [Leptospira interrogans]ULG82558.1 hypothetical protein FH595_19515 [Leptospira interrogans]ULG86452.1 hypothetical protein FH594_20515 [Leptospira interrogans]